jgi:hypothetical protein
MQYNQLVISEATFSIQNTYKLILFQVGIPVLLDWFRHFLMLGYYTFLATFADPIVR